MRRKQSVLTRDGIVHRRRPVLDDRRFAGRRWERWNGRRWEHAAYSAHPAQLRSSTPLHTHPPVDDQTAARVLARAVDHEMVDRGAAHVHDGASGIVLGYRRRVSHVLHAVLTLLTGVWALVWLALALREREDRLRFEVDSWGHVWATPVASR